MNIFGIGPVEFLIIIVLGLVIFGPERLPGMGRSLGKMVARVLAWQYTSPEAQLLMELRRDLEKEITEIRDEMIRARQALDIRPEIEQSLREAQEAVRDAEIAVRAPQGATVAAPAPGAALLNSANGANGVQLAEAPAEIVSPSGEPLLELSQPAPTDIVSPSGESLLEAPQPAPAAPLEVARPAATLEFAPAQPSAVATPDYTDFPAPPVIGPPALQVVAPDLTDFPAPPAIGSPALQATAPDFTDFPVPPAIGSPALQVVAPVAAAPTEPVEATSSQPAEPAPAYTNGTHAHTEPARVMASPSDFDLLVMQIQALANDLAAMREQLRRNGLLDAGWEPTSPLLNGQSADEPVAAGD
jgi:sec-independent protein translocase protein TatB